MAERNPLWANRCVRRVDVSVWAANVALVNQNQSQTNEPRRTAGVEANGGGAVPLMGQGEQRANGWLRDGFAWSMAGTNATPGPVAVPGRQTDALTTSPQGALKAAQRNNASAGQRTIEGTRFNTLTFTAPGQYAATLFIDAAGLVTRIE